ncbi:hypothetical protein ZWY2020_004569 [Hordeum vulgare]|nr:hypothetical protein ZWY2020_004569 [Hordeum vulgare]
MSMAMAASFAARHHHGHLAAGLPSIPQASGRTSRSGGTISMKAQKKQSSEPGSGKGAGDGRVSGGRRVWRRRKLTKEDDMLRYKLDRIPFLEEKVRKVRENGKLVCLDINQLMLSQENRGLPLSLSYQARALFHKRRRQLNRITCFIDQGTLVWGAS